MTRTQTASCDFAFSWDRRLKVQLALSILAAAGIVLVFGSFRAAYAGVAFLVVGWFWLPRSYVLSGQEVVVRPFIGDVWIPDIRSARSVPADELPSIPYTAAFGDLSAEFNGLGRTTLGLVNGM